MPSGQRVRLPSWDWTLAWINFRLSLRPANDSPQDIANAYAEFCKAIIDVVADLVPATKPQAAFFEQLGPAGMAALQAVIAYARSKELLVILDAKRGDIGSTAEGLRQGLLGRHRPLSSGLPHGESLPRRRQPAAIRGSGKRPRCTHFRPREKRRIREGNVSKILPLMVEQFMNTWQITSNRWPRALWAAAATGASGPWSERRILKNWQSFGSGCLTHFS